MKNYTVRSANKWDYENGFYLTCETGRIGKFLNHLEIYKKIVGLPGVVLEFGVYKGASFCRLAAFRDLLENSSSRKLIGFDAFGKFPNDLNIESDRNFVQNFEGAGGYGISREELKMHLNNKGVSNFELIAGDIRSTIREFLYANPSIKVALLHIDVDVYEPTKIILEAFWERLVTGGILMLDDYGTVEGETRAVDEFFEQSGVTIHKLNYYHIPAYIVKP